MDKPTVALAIEGMTCDHCAAAVQHALGRVPGVDRAEVSFPDKRADIFATEAVPETLVRAVEKVGYRASLIEPLGAQTVAPTRGPFVSSGRPTDVVVLGGGSAGFAASIRAADLGARVTLIEGGTLGGTCVNVGCVPSKTLLRAAEVQHRAAHHPFDGVRTATQAVDFFAVMAQKDALVTTLRQEKYWNVLSAYPNIRLRQGRGNVRRDLSITIDGEVVSPGLLVVTTGAAPWAPPIAGLDEAGYLTSTEALAQSRRPVSMIVIGGSAVGLEIAQLYARLGTHVTVLEAMPTLVPAEDREIGAALAGYLREEGLDVRTGASIVRVSRDRAGYALDVTVDGRGETFKGEQLLVATGRRANTRGFGLEDAGIELGKTGEIRVNQQLQTSRPEVYAAGDVTGDPMFVYVAAYAGSLAAENALNGNSRVYDLSVVPRVTFTDPAVASVGLTEAQARQQGLAVNVSTLPMAHLPRAIAAHDTRGIIKLVADGTTNLLLGAHILAPEAGDMIQEAVMAMRFDIRVDDIAAMLHPYLTSAEGLKLACQAFKKDVAKLSCCAA